jgi:hypothetical protein
MTNIDPEIPPEVREYNDKKKALLSEDYDEEETEELYDDPPDSFEDIKEIIKEVPKAIKKRHYKAVLQHELYTVSFPVEDISIADYQLALKIPRNDFKFEPTPHSKFILSVQGKKYPIVYVGGLFDFPSDATWALTFILDYDDPPSSNKFE